MNLEQLASPARYRVCVTLYSPFYLYLYKRTRSCVRLHIKWIKRIGLSHTYDFLAELKRIRNNKYIIYILFERVCVDRASHAESSAALYHSTHTHSIIGDYTRRPYRFLLNNFIRALVRHA
uniref:Uncharacterized protein n=1 Tax=Trichogramma kaykai TaxID=54128 RepID=A0ABD2XD17_9HYME